MSPSASAPPGKTRAPALPAAGMTAKNNCPPFHPQGPGLAWMWALLLPVHALREAVFPEPDDEGSRVLPWPNKGDKTFWKHLKPKKKEKT